MSARASRRFRRRLVLGAILVGIGGVVTTAIVIGNTAPPEPPPSNHPVSLEAPSHRIVLSRAERRDIVATAQVFLKTAVSRHHPERSWTLSSPSLRAGQTYQDWKGGMLPVEPYPVRVARWKLAYSNHEDVGLDVWVDSTDRHYPPLVFRLTFVRASGSKGPHLWLVDSWAPVTLSGALGSALSPYATGAQADSPRASAKSSGLWILAPFVALVVALLVPFVVTLRTRRSERRTTSSIREGA